MADESNTYSNNFSVSQGTSVTKKTSIDDYVSNPKLKRKINSPRSLTAMKELGYTQQELEYLTFDEFSKKNLKYIQDSKSVRQSKYEYFENLRREKIQEIKNRRDNLDQSQFRSKNNRPSKSAHSIKSQGQAQKMNTIGATAIENERKAFERMKNKNEMELVSMVQYELQREIMRKKAEEKVKLQIQKDEKHQRELMKKRKKEEIEKREKQKQLEEQKKKEEKILKQREREEYMEKVKQAKEEMKRERQRFKEAMEKHQEEERRRKEFDDKVNHMLEEKRRENEQRLEMLKRKEEERQKALAKKAIEEQERNREKALEQKEKYELTIKKQEDHRERVRQEFIQKQRNNEEKRKKFEELRNEKVLQAKEQGELKAKEIQRVIENNKLNLQRKVDEYYEKQRQIKEKKEELEKKTKEENKKKMLEREEKEERIKDTLARNEEILNERKATILAKIKKNEENINLVRKERELLNKKIQEDNIEKRLEREDNIRRVEIEKEQKRQETLEYILNKREKTEQFMAEKNAINEEKRRVADEIVRKRQEYSERFDLLFKKKSINEDTIRTIQDMFPDNTQINGLLKDYQSINSNKKTIDTQNRSKIEKSNYNNTSIGNYRSFGSIPDGERKRAVSSKPRNVTTSYSFQKSITQGEQVKNPYANEVNVDSKWVAPQGGQSSQMKSVPHSTNDNFNTNYTIKTKTNTSNLKKEEDQRVKNYRAQLNREFLQILSNEKQKESMRERQLDRLSEDDPRRAELEKKFGEERAIADNLISKKNE